MGFFLMHYFGTCERNLVVECFRNTGSIIKVMSWPMTFHTVFHRKIVETSFVI
ncbi:unnamed protein product [Protopolystoma xenopodis]|uniref:Uncharacterized protein n=1 Tax=Protopolystoma xenopodis TaxID=117903 RepID=A0A448XF33_9PLAT|nr:unnamed protein product [Protopolystoma xenopodis]